MKPVIAAAVLCMLSVAAIVLAQPEKIGPKLDYDLLVKRTDKAMPLSAELTDQWKQAPLLTVKTFSHDGKTGPDVDLRAMHDGEYIYIWTRWADATESTVKGAWEFGKDGWARLKGDEDRFAIAFAGNVKEFATQGCTALCHDGDMRTDKEEEVADLWHWKAARGGMHGSSDDHQFKFAKESGRVDDAGTSAYRDNKAADGKSPARRWKDDADRKSGFSEETSVEIAEGFKPEVGYTVPAVILRKPSGSRGDVEAVGAYKDGHWQVMFKRKLATGNADDVALASGTNTHLAVAVFDNTGATTGEEHLKGRPMRVRVE